jgi:hypothetical protein
VQILLTPRDDQVNEPFHGPPVATEEPKKGSCEETPDLS